MGKKLNEIAKDLKNANKTVQLIYAFNGSGKTRLSRAFKEHIYSDNEGVEHTDQRKILYYSAFTEDLFYWNNKSDENSEYKLLIQPNEFLDWILDFQGEGGIAANFQYFTNKKLTPSFIPEVKQFTNADGRRENRYTFPEVRFSYGGGGDLVENVKISKGEESNFIWSIFFTLIQEVVSLLEETDAKERSDNQFDELEYIFIDDPVSSLDENHLIALAVDLASLIKKSESSLKFIITTHSALFYNVLHNELGLNKGSKREGCYLLECNDDGSFTLNTKYGDSNRSFSYHLHLKRIIENAISANKIERYHFALIRNLYEKTASFLGYERWSKLLPGDQAFYFNRIIQFTSHSTLSDYAVSEPSPEEKEVIGFLLNHLVENFSYWREESATDE